VLVIDERETREGITGHDPIPSGTCVRGAQLGEALEIPFAAAASP
jgi:hypothetical protein